MMNVSKHDQIGQRNLVRNQESATKQVFVQFLKNGSTSIQYASFYLDTRNKQVLSNLKSSIQFLRSNTLECSNSPAGPCFNLFTIIKYIFSLSFRHIQKKNACLKKEITNLSLVFFTITQKFRLSLGSKVFANSCNAVIFFTRNLVFIIIFFSYFIFLIPSIKLAVKFIFKRKKKLRKVILTSKETSVPVSRLATLSDFVYL